MLAAFSVWVENKKRPLGEILCKQGKITKSQFELLYALAEQHIELHGSDPEKSLAALSSVGSVREDLKKLNDFELDASLAATIVVESGLSALEPTLVSITMRCDSFEVIALLNRSRNFTNRMASIAVSARDP